MDRFPDWSGLLPELLVEIACHLPLIEDFTAFRGVCTNWRAAGAAKAKQFKGLSQVPILMLSEKDESDEREFYSFSRSKIFMRMPVPEAKGKKCMDAGFGWILTVGGGEVSLLNPFASAAKIELPNTQKFPGITRAVLSADPSLTSNFTVFVVKKCYMECWRSGDKSWTRLYACTYFCGSICYYMDKMYAFDILTKLWAWDPHGTDNPTRTEFFLQPGDLVFTELSQGIVYLVEASDGELLIIFRCVKSGATNFRVARVDLEKKECKEMNGIGKNAVFLGCNRPVSLVAADFPGVLKPNCIYYTEDFPVYCYMIGRDQNGKTMGVYNLEDGSTEGFAVESFNPGCPPQWIFPSF